jgi:hypothetical protein
MECPKRHRMTNHCLTTWRLTELYAEPWRRRRRRCREDCILWVLTDVKLEVQSCRPMSVPGGLARRFGGNVSANGMPTMSLRRRLPPISVSPRRTLRRAMANQCRRRCRTYGLSAGLFVRKLSYLYNRSSMGFRHEVCIGRLFLEYSNFRTQVRHYLA